jgi:hypothetical protein
MTTIEIAMFLAPLVVGFGVGYLANRRQGDSPQQAIADTLVEMFEKYFGKQPQEVVAEPARSDHAPLIDVIHKLIDRIGDKK